MHFHPDKVSPSPTPAFCVDHAPDDEPMYECRSERCVCVICEEGEEAA